MINWSAFYRLTRLDKPVGILLLWYPTAWALWVANHGIPELRLLVLFFMGTLLMRSAGCVINDIADRNVDRHVARTKLRPLTSGEVGLTEAFLILGFLLFASLIVLIYLPHDCFYLALISLVITFLYPFCKRFLNTPQIILGLAFSMGIPMAYVASYVPMNCDLVILLIINFAWIVAYDTMYAMTDKEDDLKVGIKSTAIYFADYDRLIIGLLLFSLHLLWFFWAYARGVSYGFYVFWGMGAGILLWQMKLIHNRNPQNCFKAFLMSSYYGAVMWMALSLAF
ncbi:4-hydroxybenzoate octaprenyltransferase [Legionella worsleiensis]|uniref:4-hydroxybenzoate octaprenyltransferase n=1 Tax=Legionella worsleiensis TaxID=45076 RepID=A0A0W1A6W8_9GAMM|nr:4-hydroxybenzoate octaprenyltransferase [Legionella worsleiensis]KTD76928.1 4-hydroxybenzoate polyprenyltransferase [Legionella worsleiensis]STY33401.1 4-hydroxybenzoate octaprenyltransferase [Legionella worsleiensis]